MLPSPGAGEGLGVRAVAGQCDFGEVLALRAHKRGFAGG